MAKRERPTTPAIPLPATRFEAFALFADLNGYETFTRTSGGNLLAQFVRDCLYGGIECCEAEGGHVVNFTGDGFLALFTEPDALMRAIFGIANDIDHLREYLFEDDTTADLDGLAPEGPTSLKLTVEHGWVDRSTISSQFVGTSHLFAGPGINYAARLQSAGVGNRCYFGPIARFHADLQGYDFMGPLTFTGKKGRAYEYYHLDLGDIWVEGSPEPGQDSSVR